MIYGSVCSGIEAASVAWHPLGWRAAFVSEIDAFPRAVLTHHYPDVPLHGDFTTIEGGHYAAIDVLVGGTPCQSFSIAGLRGGLADERGNLALEFCRLAQRLGPKWVVWENVPGVLSMDGGRAFASILGGLSECGYGVAYRVLDAQFVRIHGFGRAVPQRRRRVFVVGYLGDWRRAAAVLFERHSLQRNPPPRRQAREGITHSVAPSLVSSGRGVERGGDTRGQDPVIAVHSSGANGKAAGSATSQDAENGLLVAHSLRGDGFDASEDGTGRGTPLVPVPQGVALRGREGGATAELCFSAKDHGADTQDNLSPTMRAGGHSMSHANAGVMPAIAYRTTGNDGAYETGDITDSLTTGTDPTAITLLQSWRVRRLTPRECERLQGFPDDYTAIPYRKGVSSEKITADWFKYIVRGNPKQLTRDDVARIAADGPRYKALGNSMAVPVMRWIGTRIEIVEKLTTES